MKKASVRDLRYRFRDVEELLRQGQPVEITKRRKVIARLVASPRPTSPRCPDFLARLKHLFGNKRMRVSGADLLSQERDRV
jgi:antitoxin (DNA-binding transcriptional repressor) of toxin-antitoxin stability system